MYGHQCSQAITAFATKACKLATNKVAHVELLRGLRCSTLWLWPIETNKAGDKKDFLSSEKKAKLKAKKIIATFGKSLFVTKCRMRYAIYMPPNPKDLAINQTMVAHGNCRNATAFARVNNSDLLRSTETFNGNQALWSDALPANTSDWSWAATRWIFKCGRCCE